MLTGKYLINALFGFFRHLIKINKCRLWGTWEIEWVVDLDDVISMPKINGSELILQLKQVTKLALILITINFSPKK